MDGQRFDRLTLELGKALSRRRLGGLLAALGLGLTGPHVEAKKKGRHHKQKPKKCKHGTIKCGKRCVNTKTNAAHCGACGRACGANVACVNGTCQGGGCPGDQLLCHGQCVDPSDNEEHCGRCDRACDGDLTCIDGECGCADPADTRCGNECVDTQTDEEHCGDCDTACDDDETCSNGRCAIAEETCFNSDDCCGDDPFCDLFCNANHRCECISSQAGHHRCLPDAPTRCGVCCAGGVDLGGRCYNLGGGNFGDLVCMSATDDGCRCPHGFESCPNRSGFCSIETDTDPRRCGPACEDCTINDPAIVCCGGRCTRGGSPGFNGVFGPCGGDCEDCPQGFMCCNKGPGTPDECVPAAPSCPPPGP